MLWCTLVASVSYNQTKHTWKSMYSLALHPLLLICSACRGHAWAFKNKTRHLKMLPHFQEGVIHSNTVGSKRLKWISTLPIYCLLFHSYPTPIQQLDIFFLGGGGAWDTVQQIPCFFAARLLMKLHSTCVSPESQLQDSGWESCPPDGIREADDSVGPVFEQRIPTEHYWISGHVSVFVHNSAKGRK